MEESAPIVNLSAGPTTMEKRKSVVNEFLTYTDRDGPGLVLDPTACPTLLEGLAGGYRYSDNQNDVESIRPMPVKDQYSHPADAFQYMCAGAVENKGSHSVTIARPSYSFTHANRG
jgi:hypothetical protein